MVPNLTDQCVGVLLGALGFRDAIELDAQRLGVRLRVEVSRAEAVTVEAILEVGVCRYVVLRHFGIVACKNRLNQRGLARRNGGQEVTGALHMSERGKAHFKESLHFAQPRHF